MRRKRRLPGQDIFNAEFQRRLGLWVREQAHRKRSWVAVAAVLGLGYVAGVSPWLGAAVAVLVIVVLIASHDTAGRGGGEAAARSSEPASSTPADDDDRTELVEGGSGDLAYDLARRELRALIDRDVSVVIAGPDDEPVATLAGRLHPPTNISRDDLEVLSWPVGALDADGAPCFYTSRALFMAGDARLTRMPVDGNLRLEMGGFVVWVFEHEPAGRR